jgi:predicted kinase
MEAIVLIGLQASGKTSFYLERFSLTHVRISLDMLRTRSRERKLLDFCVQNRQRFVSDNTNTTTENRALFIDAAKEKRFSVVGYYFTASFEECVARNATRKGDQRVPQIAIRVAADKLQVPSLDEGFDELHYVQLDDRGFTLNGFRLDDQ